MRISALRVYVAVFLVSGPSCGPLIIDVDLSLKYQLIIKSASRLTEGVDVYFLAKQMGTSVKMIEDHYGHVTPVKNADRILQGLPGWEPIAAAPQEAR
jgi:hypothetical protein